MIFLRTNKDKYFPISLGSCICKLVEIIVNCRMMCLNNMVKINRSNSSTKTGTLNEIQRERDGSSGAPLYHIPVKF